MPFNIGAPELILVLVVVLILFGPGKLPEVGQALGKTVREFRHASNDLDLNAQPAAAAATPAATATQAATATPATADTSPTTESDSAGS
jgi:sec-independent protein translocase protein TatA